MANDKYRKAIFNAQVYANSGAATYEKAVDMATKDMRQAGLNCIEYKSGARHTLSDYADMALRTASKRAYLTGEGEKRAEWGIHTVIMNKRGNACSKCLPFVGKVMIDDVWSGGTAEEASQLGYGLMSTAVSAGLYHPRCKDSHTTYFPGITTQDKATKEENQEVCDNYNNEIVRQYAKRQAEKYQRMEDTSLDDENQKKYAARAEEWKDKVEINSSFKLANNIDGAQNYAESNGIKDAFMTLPDYIAEYIKSVAKTSRTDIIKNIEVPSDVISIGGMTKDTEKAINMAVEKITTQYDAKVNSIVVESLGNGFEKVPFQYVPENVGGFLNSKIVINRDYYFNDSLESYNARIMRNHNSGALAAQNIEDLISHEMAHVMTFQDCETYGEFRRVEQEVRGKFIKGMSAYADSTYDGAETIAEAFVRSRHGEKLPKDILALLNEYIERRRK